MGLEFSDGIKIDTSGPLRPLHLKDGWYVVGEGWLIAVSDKEDAAKTILEMEKLHGG